MLKPKTTATRELQNLDGLWSFKVDFADEGFAAQWASSPLNSELQAAVPASYNELFTDLAIRNHVGWVWYQRTVRVPRGWAGESIFVRADSATHEGVIFVNGVQVAQHSGGYMPFESDISHLVSAGEEFVLTIAVSNILTNETIPPGRVWTKDNGDKQQDYLFDFFNYSGLARSVWIYSVPKIRIEDITIVTDFEGSTGKVGYDIEVSGAAEVKLSLVDETGATVATGVGVKGQLTVSDVKLWQPGAAYLYRLTVELVAGSALVDSYELHVGVRTVKVVGNQFLINNEPFYF
ncbi:MAG: sugar-binding domain-containing protein, partial [Actinomycetes bacterium]